MISLCWKEYGMDIGNLVEGKSSTQSKHNGEYAHFLYHFNKSLQDIADQEPMDVIKFIEEQNMNGAQASSLYYTAKAERERAIQRS